MGGTSLGVGFESSKKPLLSFALSFLFTVRDVSSVPQLPRQPATKLSLRGNGLLSLWNGKPKQTPPSVLL